MCLSDQWLIIPSVRITYENLPFKKNSLADVINRGTYVSHTIGIELGFLNRWCAIEVSLTKEVWNG